MYYLKKRIEISASHKLDLDYESKCKTTHGHNWIINIYCKAKKLNKNDMIIDFTDIKKRLHDVIDHKNLNTELAFNPTAENISKWIVDTIPFCYKAEVQESEGNVAWYEN